MDTITVDGVDENAFRHEIEDMLRFDAVDEATERLRALLEPYARPGGILPERFLTVTAADVQITGWDKLASRLSSHDRPQFPISAIGVVLSDARVLGGPGPQGGCLAPFIKTYYFTDDAYPFTNAAREDLLDGYTREGFGWQGDYQATDATLAIKGIDDLHGTIIELEDRLLDIVNPPEEFLRAGTIGACFLAALIHQALRDTIRKQGLPRPLCVLAACDGVYPFFDAPVAGWDDCLAAVPKDAVPADVWPSELEDDSHAEGSLLALVSRKGAKHMALELGEDDLREAARLAQDAGAERLVMTDDNALRGLFHGVPMAELVQAAEHMLEAEDEGGDSAGDGAGSESGLLAEPSPEPVPVPVPEAVPAPEPELRFSPEPPAPYDPFAEARAAFRQAEEAKAFPSGSSLRNRFKEEPPQKEIGIAEAMQSARARLNRSVRRSRLRVGLMLAAGQRQIGAAASRVRRAGASCRAVLLALIPRRRR